jgi:hypothetical protein
MELPRTPELPRLVELVNDARLRKGNLESVGRSSKVTLAARELAPSNVVISLRPER